jgi:predicted amidophosphoribosyltransferase
MSSIKMLWRKIEMTTQIIIENEDGKCKKCGKPVDKYELECEECIKKEILGE